MTMEWGDIDESDISYIWLQMVELIVRMRNEREVYNIIAWNETDFITPSIVREICNL